MDTYVVTPRQVSKFTYESTSEPPRVFKEAQADDTMNDQPITPKSPAKLQSENLRGFKRQGDSMPFFCDDDWSGKGVSTASTFKLTGCAAYGAVLVEC